MADMSNQDLQKALATLKEDLLEFHDDSQTLDVALESASKHVPAYVKIVKGHIDQLRNVLQLENHNHRSLESVGLAKPVQQLMKIFEHLQEEDIAVLEELAFAAHNWQSEASDELATEKLAEVTAG